MRRRGKRSAYTVVDCVGDYLGSPRLGWEVCGVSKGTKDHTLVRKQSIQHGNPDWRASAGTDSGDCEWLVHPKDDWRYASARQCLRRPTVPSLGTKPLATLWHEATPAGCARRFHVRTQARVWLHAPK